MEDFILTEGEQSFISKFLSSNGCNATNAKQLLNDNFSCQCIEDLYGMFPNLTKSQIGGYLSSLQEKNVLWLEERDGPICKSKNPTKYMNYEPHLYWVGDPYLESLDLEAEF